MNHPQSAREGALKMELGEARRSPALCRHYKRAASRERRRHDKAVIAEEIAGDAVDERQWLEPR